VPAGAAIALIDGEHHPGVVREALDRLDPVATVFCGGWEKLPAGPLEQHYGRPVRQDAEAALRELAAAAARVVDLADEPPLPASAKLHLAALALSLGLAYEAPGVHLRPPRYEAVPFDGPTLAVIGTAKRTGKTALAGHWASLLPDPVIVCMGRGGPAQPRLAEPGASLDHLIALSERGEHAASDYLEDALLAGVRSVGCRRLGGGFAGEPAESNVAAGAALAASLRPGSILFEGSGACIPPVAVDRTVCVVGAGAEEPFADYRLLRADLVLAAEGTPAPPGALRFRLRPEPADGRADGDRIALFTTGADSCEGVEPVLVSTNLSRRAALAEDLERAAASRCDLYLTELKAAAIDTVAVAARERGAGVAFVRNRPLGIDCDLDEELLKLVP
jgi:cyclic 2,3-diphosphoglycerate synthetase